MLVTASQSWWITKDGFRVPAGHPEAVGLLINAGCLIAIEALERFPVLEDERETKHIERAPETKGGKRGRD